jgi:filamentous hemagglutinin
MGAMLAASLSGKDPLTALNAAQTVDNYNRQLHPEEKKLIRSLAEQKAREGCQGDTLCQNTATLYWTDALERVAESRVDDKEYLKTANYLNQLEKTAAIQGSEGQMGTVSRYFADLETAARMLDPYTGKTIVVNGQTATLNGDRQTYFSATPEQRANTGGNYFLGVPPDPSIIPGMAERDQTRLEQAGVKSGSVQPVYPAEEIALGGPLTSKVLGALGRAWGALDVALAGKVGASAGGNISTQQVTREGIAASLNAAERASLSPINTLTDTEQSALREKVTNSFFARNGFTRLEGKCGTQCFDGVFVKGDTVYVVETKPMKDNLSIKLNSANKDTGLATQMTPEWVKSRAEVLASTNDPVKQQTAALIEQARNNLNGKTLVKIVAGVNENGVTLVKLAK